MTTEEKARAYDEALEVMRQWIAPCHTKEQLDTLKKSVFPELAESEDERIRKQLIDAIKIGRSNSGISFTEEAASRYIAWLEKQKEQKQEWSEEDENMRESAIALIRKWPNYSGENVGDSIKVISWLQWLPLLAHQH